VQHQVLHPLTSSSFLNLVRLTASYGCQPRFVPRLLYLGLVCALRRPLAWLESARYGRAIRRQKIEPAPIFVVGHWRSGTTHLQNLLCQDPQFGRVTLLQAGMPHDFLVFPDKLLGRMQEMLPQTRLMDNVAVSADAPWEEEMALVSLSRLSFYHVSFFPREVEGIFREAVLLNGGDEETIERWQRHYLYFLKKVQLADPDRRLLLKNPANTARISVLRKLFPKAKFIHIHRDPYRVFTSTVHLYLKAQEAWGLHAVDRDHVVRHILESYPQLMTAYFEQRGALGEDELVEVSFHDLQQDPMRALATIYRQIGLEHYDAAAPLFSRYIEGQQNYSKNVLSLSDWERNEVSRRWRQVFDELGYAVRPVQN